jgi:hypothetical protein
MRHRLTTTAVLLLLFQDVWNHGVARATPKPPDDSELLGIWRGTSICTDRQAAPACKDEQAVYEFTPGPRPGVVHWIADKMVDGKRQNMGESDVTYDAAEHCWKVEMTGARVKSVWRLAVSGDHMTGTARQLPGNETIRKIDLHKQ